MFKFTKCDFCPVKDRYFNVYSIPFTYFDGQGISPLDFDFLLENIFEYRGKLMLRGTEKAEKEHVKAQIERIFWIFNQYGIPKQMINDVIPFRDRRKFLYSLIRMTRERTNT